MENIKIATAQFENRSGDKDFNLDKIRQLSARAREQGARAVAFHECSLTGYTFAGRLSGEQMTALAEFVPEGDSTRALTGIAKENGMIVLAGLFEKDEDGHLYNTYVCVNEKGLVARHRKLHPFINPSLRPGDSYTIFEILGWKCGILTCYDNNIIENVRATSLLGADVIFMPHVTMCTPSTRPGAGFVNPRLWENRERDPTSLRLEFDGMKGRSWLMKWLPARAYDNAVYAVFSNPVGMDDDQLKNGCSMIIDPFGDVVSECRFLGDEVVTATLTPEKIARAGGYRYKMARRPDLYSSVIGQAHLPEQKVSWMQDY